MNKVFTTLDLRFIQLIANSARSLGQSQKPLFQWPKSSLSKSQLQGRLMFILQYSDSAVYDRSSIAAGYAICSHTPSQAWPATEEARVILTFTRIAAQNPLKSLGLNPFRQLRFYMQRVARDLTIDNCNQVLRNLATVVNKSDRE